MVNGTDLVAAIDWIEAEAGDRDSRFYRKVDVEDVAAMGMSCGGLMSYGASKDPRVATVGIWNSGLFPDENNPNANADIYNGIHGSVIIVTGGGESDPTPDIAYANGKRDFEVMPPSVPVFYGVYPSVGHGGTYSQDNGGPYGIAAVAWLKWQLMGDRSAAGRGFFVGNNCGICVDSNWLVDSRSLR
jgi:dienelactone hydrolase